MADDYYAVCFVLDISEEKNYKTLGTATENVRAAIDAARKAT
jgi:hypothetical protein